MITGDDKSTKPIASPNSKCKVHRPKEKKRSNRARNIPKGSLLSFSISIDSVLHSALPDRKLTCSAYLQTTDDMGADEGEVRETWVVIAVG